MKKFKSIKKASKKITKKSLKSRPPKVKLPKIVDVEAEVEVVVPPVVEVPVKKKKVSVMYFTQDTEDAIVAYNTTHDKKEKDRIYNEKIRFPFEKIAENIFNTFKFSYNEVAPLEVQREAVSHMVANMEKYEKGKGKAFSYFSIVAKHWFILENNNNYRRFKKHVSISEQPGDIGEFVVEPEH